MAPINIVHSLFKTSVVPVCNQDYFWSIESILVFG